MQEIHFPTQKRKQVNQIQMKHKKTNVLRLDLTEPLPGMARVDPPPSATASFFLEGPDGAPAAGPIAALRTNVETTLSQCW